MADVTENTDFTEIDAYADGMLISNSYTSSSDWSSAVKDAFAKLSLGQYSQVFEDTNGLHIIYYVSDEKAGSKTLDEVHDAIAATLTADNSVDEIGNMISADPSESPLIFDPGASDTGSPWLFGTRLSKNGSTTAP